MNTIYLQNYGQKYQKGCSFTSPRKVLVTALYNGVVMRILSINYYYLGASFNWGRKLASTFYNFKGIVI